MSNANFGTTQNVPQAWTNLLAYVLQGDLCNRTTPRIIDIAYNAFMLAKRPNDEDGGPSDWFNDTKPKIVEMIAKLEKDLVEEFPGTPVKLEAQLLSPTEQKWVLLKLALAYKEYIDALPADVVAALPAMPGVDGDWADDVLGRSGRAAPQPAQAGVQAETVSNKPFEYPAQPFNQWRGEMQAALKRSGIYAARAPGTGNKLTLHWRESRAVVTPAPQPSPSLAPAQPGQEGEWIDDAGRIKWLLWRVQDLEKRLSDRAAYTAPQPATNANWEQLRSALALLMLGWLGNANHTMEGCNALLDSVTEPGMPLALLRSAPDWRHSPRRT